MLADIFFNTKIQPKKLPYLRQNLLVIKKNRLCRRFFRILGGSFCFEIKKKSWK